ncbi:unnamed protein product, partial [marine sediment metagenome]
SSGIILSMLANQMKEAENFMIENLGSKDNTLQKCSLIAFRWSLFHSPDQKMENYFGILKKITPVVSKDNMSLLIQCLLIAWKDNKEEFEPILESEIINRGQDAATTYIGLVQYRKEKSIIVLQRGVEILESKIQDSEYIDIGLADIFETDPDFVLERLKKRIQDGQVVRLMNNDLLRHIRKADINPILRLVESQIDEGYIPYLGEGILEDLFVPHDEPSLEKWANWCEKWVNDERKKSIILSSLGIILT